MRFTFIKINSNRRFQFEPRYYDPQQDELEGRVAVSESDAKSDDKMRMRISDAFQKRDRQEKKTVYIRLLLVFVLTAVLIGVYYWVAQLT